MKIILGADHGGYQLKERIKIWLEDKGQPVEDVGATEMISDDDYVDYAKEAVRRASEGVRIILFCRNGFGMVITANRYKGIRCGLGFNVEAVKRGRLDDDINVLAIPADYVSDEEVKEMIEVFLKEGFSAEEKYKRRLSKLDSI